MADIVNGSEDDLQAKCFQWFWNTYPEHRRMLFAVPNGGHRDKITANRLKATGVVPGVSDLILVVLEGVIFIEMKTETGVQSKEQLDFQLKVESRGHWYYVVRTFNDFKELINSYINGK